jgi:hypothetical protein
LESRNAFDFLSKRRLPRGSWSDFLFVEPWFDAFLGQLLPDHANRWLVLAVVAQEDIKDFLFGVLYVHTNGNLISLKPARPPLNHSEVQRQDNIGNGAAISCWLLKR